MDLSLHMFGCPCYSSGMGKGFNSRQISFLFVARIGKSQLIISDNVPQFKVVAKDSSIDRQSKQFMLDEEVRHCTEGGIKWRFTTTMVRGLL